MTEPICPQCEAIDSLRESANLALFNARNNTERNVAAGFSEAVESWSEEHFEHAHWSTDRYLNPPERTGKLAPRPQRERDPEHTLYANEWADWHARNYPEGTDK